MTRGEIWWANVRKPIGRRPVLLLTRHSACAVRASITVAPITRTIHQIPVEIQLGTDDGLPKPCVVNLDDIFTIRKERLERFITSLKPTKIALVDQAIKFALGLR